MDGKRRELLPIAPVDRMPDISCRPVFEGLWPDPDHVRAEFALGVDEAEGKSTDPWRKMTSKVPVAAELYVAARECLLGEAFQVPKSLFVRFRICMPLHLYCLAHLTLRLTVFGKTCEARVLKVRVQASCYEFILLFYTLCTVCFRV